MLLSSLFGYERNFFFVKLMIVNYWYLIHASSDVFMQNLKWTGSSEPVLTATSHMMSLITLTVHLSVVAAVIVASHYYGRGYGDALGNSINTFFTHLCQMNGP
jgi:hypothetical protein